MKKTTYHCRQYGPCFNRILETVHYADTETTAIEWLENNGGGVYRNSLHNFSMRVDPV